MPPESDTRISSPIPSELTVLLERKIKQERNELDRMVTTRLIEIDSRLTQRVKDYVPLSGQRAGRLSIFQKTYRELVDLAGEVTNSWPETVVATFRKTLGPLQPDRELLKQLEELFDRTTWSAPTDAFPAELVDAKALQRKMDVKFEKYGLPDCESETNFARQRDLDSALARVEIRNKARDSKERAALELGEFLLRSASQHEGGSGSAERHSSGPSVSTPSLRDCFPSFPTSKETIWNQIISRATREFIEENKKCPTHHDLWQQICNKPPKGYRIENRLDNGGEDAIWCRHESLGKKAFQQRFRNYKKPKKPQ